MSGPARPLPVVTELTRPFWDAARAGRLAVQKCQECGKLRFPASPLCDACLATSTAWVEVSGRGTVWSACEFHRSYFPGFDVPYAVALVRLDEGVRMYTNLVGVDYAGIEPGMRVQAVFDPVTDDVTLIKFRPAP